MEFPAVRMSLQMGITHEDFLRTVEIFMEGRDYSVSGTHITIPGDDRRVEIALSEQGERRIGPTIRLPRTPVEIAFFGYPEDERKRFMDRFEMIFRRGGG